MVLCLGSIPINGAQEIDKKRSGKSKKKKQKKKDG